MVQRTIKEETMTPNEKAAQLVVDYQLKVKSLDYKEAVACAKITVDEVIANIEPSVSMDVIEARVNYWNEVKQILERLQ